MNDLIAILTRPAARRALLRRRTPLTQRRGIAIDAWYSDTFIRRHCGVSGYVTGDLSGRVLEVCTAEVPPLPDRLGAREQLGQIERMSMEALTTASADSLFDAVVCPLSIAHVADCEACFATLHRALKPGGVLLATLHSVSEATSIAEGDGVLWRPTPLGLRRLTESVFPARSVTVESFGNLLSATAHMYGLTAADLRARERELHDPDFPVVVAVRAMRAL